MSVNVMNGLHEKCQSVNQASFLECEPTEVFLHGCHTRVSVPVLVNISCAFILDGFECLDSGKLMRVPHDAAIFHGWSNQALIDFTSDRRCGSTQGQNEMETTGRQTQRCKEHWLKIGDNEIDDDDDDMRRVCRK